ncbi:hypothetical protein OG339_47310 (plasmid) [Streptosporangium sp. NBC_01495]|uniref:hypothetical protein n=1 Tax=Streptosporangium sp. NBC_01495 TaxID=2903899 RepID=UPI002E31203F|nr:hypothetical protein [Streptosporangium sp. NBC_01495]
MSRLWSKPITSALRARSSELELWDLTKYLAWTAHPLEKACAMSSRGLTRSEWTDYVQTADFLPTC